MRWAYAGHPPALWLDDGQELIAPKQGAPLGISDDPEYVEGSRTCSAGMGVLIYTDGLTEARRDGQRLGLAAVSAALGSLQNRSPTHAVAVLHALAADFVYGALTDDLCLLAAVDRQLAPVMKRDASERALDGRRAPGLDEDDHAVARSVSEPVGNVTSPPRMTAPITERWRASR